MENASAGAGINSFLEYFFKAKEMQNQALEMKAQEEYKKQYLDYLIQNMTAENAPEEMSPLDQARIDLIQAQIGKITGRGGIKSTIGGGIAPSITGTSINPKYILIDPKTGSVSTKEPLTGLGKDFKAAYDSLYTKYFVNPHVLAGGQTEGEWNNEFLNELSSIPGMSDFLSSAKEAGLPIQIPAALGSAPLETYNANKKATEDYERSGKSREYVEKKAREGRTSTIKTIGGTDEDIVRKYQDDFIRIEDTFKSDQDKYNWWSEKGVKNPKAFFK